jgi:hypothetical protein
VNVSQRRAGHSCSVAGGRPRFRVCRAQRQQVSCNWDCLIKETLAYDF